jgi:hypothetical protein
MQNVLPPAVASRLANVQLLSLQMSEERDVVLEMLNQTTMLSLALKADKASQAKQMQVHLPHLLLPLHLLLRQRQKQRLLERNSSQVLVLQMQTARLHAVDFSLGRLVTLFILLNTTSLTF